MQRLGFLNIKKAGPKVIKSSLDDLGGGSGRGNFLGTSSEAEARQAPRYGRPGPIRPPGIIPKNRFSAGFLGFEKKLNYPLHFF